MSKAGKARIIITALLFVIAILPSWSCDDDDDDNDSLTDPGPDDDDTDDDADDDDDTGDGISYWPFENAPTDFAEWFEDFAWLKDTSLYFDHIGPTDTMGRGKQGDFGFGNGRVFALMGLNDPLNTLTEFTGPFYQAASGKFGDCPSMFWVGEKKKRFNEQWIWRVRGAAIMVTKEITQDRTLALYTVTFTPPGIDAICRMLIAVNLGDESIENVAIHTKPWYDSQERVAIVEQHITQVRDDEKTLYIGGFENDSGVLIHPSGKGLAATWEKIEAGEQKTALIYFAFTSTGGETTVSDIRTQIENAGFDGLLEQTRQWWGEYLGGGAALRTPDPKVNDLYEGMQITIASSTDERGGVSEMSRYTSAWLRDTFGATLFYLSIGRVEDAFNMMDYIYRVSIDHQAIRNSMPLDIDIGDTTDPQNPREFWEGVNFMPGRDKAESPSYIPLGYAHYYKITGDLDTIRERYEFLRATLTLQERTPENLLPFSGDETFRYPLMFVIPSIQEPGVNWYSANSSFLFVAAAERMAQLADDLADDAEVETWTHLADEVRQATEQYYWQGDHYAVIVDKQTLEPWPLSFEDVSTKPIFTGYLDPDTEQARSHVDHFVSYLMRDDGTLLSPKAIFGYGPTILYDGMVPGLFLDNAARVDHPTGELAFNALDLTASLSGNYSEMHWRNHNMFTATHAKSGRIFSEVTSRFRTWEGGYNLNALVQYLIGADIDYPNHRLSLFPRLPNNWPELEMLGMPAGSDGSYDLRVVKDGLAWTVTITSHASEDLTVDLRLSEDGEFTPSAAPDIFDSISTQAVYERTQFIGLGAALPAGGSLTTTITFQ